MLPSPRYGNPGNGGGNPRYGNPRPRSLIMQKVDGDYASASSTASRRNSDVASRRNSTVSRYEDRIEQEQNKVSENVDSSVQDGNEKLKQAKANLSDDLAYVQAGARRASKYDLY